MAFARRLLWTKRYGHIFRQLNHDGTPWLYINRKDGPLISQRRWQTVGGGPATPNPGANLPDPPESEDSPQGQTFGSQWGPTLFKMLESAATTFASIFILGLVGYSYTWYYKYRVLRKIENAFAPGDPILDLASKGKGPEAAERRSKEHWIPREEQDMIDAILDGSDQGHYFLMIGEKGTGKSSMLIESMQRVDGEGISMFDAHGDIEIVRIRLGKALDFEFHEDNMGSLFSIRGPRDASALLDIERAFNKFEKVALKRRNSGKTPMVLIINSLHLIRDDDDGKDLLELIQQKAEQWCASNICTVVLNSDDYWVYERLKQHATRMELLPVLDLPKDKAIIALRKHRRKWFNEDTPEEILEKVYDRVGGRLSYLNKVAKAEDMDEMCDEICTREKSWFLSKCWILGEEMDDDVMDQQKYASAAMVLAKALVDKEKEMEKRYDPKIGHLLPTIPMHEARQIMTRADFLKSYDQQNLFAIDTKGSVRADSVPMQNAFREICSQEGFDEHLEGTLERIAAIESLGRTRELTIKDLWNKGQYEIKMVNARGQLERRSIFEVAPKEDENAVE